MTKKRLAVAALAASVSLTAIGGALVACTTPDEPGVQGVYTVTFDAQGGYVTPQSATTVEGKLSELPTPTPAPSQPVLTEFAGWYLTATYTGDALTVDYVYTQDTTIYARYTTTEPALVYTVTFDAGEGTYVGPTVETINGYIESLPNPTAPSATMKFIGWYTEATGGERVTTQTKLTGEQTAVTLYARYQQEYVIAFDAGDGTLEATTLLTDDGKIAELPTPTAPGGYAFDGWYTEETGGDKVTSATVLTADGTLYARYVQNEYTVSFDANGGTLAEGTEAVTTTDGKLTALPDDPTPPTNAVFLGWYTTAAEGGELVTTDTVLLSDGETITLYARYRQEYVITFDAGEGELAEGAAATAVTLFGMVEQLPEATHAEKAFVGWYTAQTGGTRVSTAYAFGSDATVYARYRTIEVEYTVSFDANGGTLEQAIEPMTTTGGKLTALPAAPTPPTNMKFIGWYTEATGGDKVTTAYVFDADGTEVTLYAHYQQEYVITFTAGEGTLEATTAVTDDGKVATLPTPTAPTGYEFDGWYTQATGGTKITASTVFTADTEVFAQYKLTEYVITFNANGGTLAEGTVSMMTAGGKLASLPTDPTPPTNSKFLGWYTAAENGDEVTTDYPFVGDVHELTVYAVYKQEYVITFDANGGTLGAGDESSAFTVNGKLAALPTDPTPPVYKIFKGWFTAETSGTEITTDYLFNASATVYAQYAWIDGVYAGDTKIEATFTVNPANKNEVMISGFVLEEDTTIKIAYNGAIVAIDKAKSGGDATYLDDGESVLLTAGTYNGLYYTFATTSSDYKKLWVSKQPEQPDEDKNAAFTYATPIGASGAYLVGKFQSRGMGDFAWGDGYQMTETSAGSNVYKLENIYLYAGDVIKARAGSGDGKGHSVWKQESGIYNWNNSNCNIEKEGYYTVTIDISAGNNDYELKVTYVGETIPA